MEKKLEARKEELMQAMETQSKRIEQLEQALQETKTNLIAMKGALQVTDEYLQEYANKEEKNTKSKVK